MSLASYIAQLIVAGGKKQALAGVKAAATIGRHQSIDHGDGVDFDQAARIRG